MIVNICNVVYAQEATHEFFKNIVISKDVIFKVDKLDINPLEDSLVFRNYNLEEMQGALEEFLSLSKSIDKSLFLEYIEVLKSKKVPDNITKALALKIELAYANLARSEVSSVEYNGRTYDLNETAIANLSGRLATMEAKDTIEWIDGQNVIAQLSKTDVKGLLGAMLNANSQAAVAVRKNKDKILKAAK